MNQYSMMNSSYLLSIFSSFSILLMEAIEKKKKKELLQFFHIPVLRLIALHSGIYQKQSIIPEKILLDLGLKPLQIMKIQN